MNRSFEVRESGISAAQDLRQREKSVFLKHGKPTGKHGVTRQRYCEITFFGLVGHFFLPSLVAYRPPSSFLGWPTITIDLNWASICRSVDFWHGWIGHRKARIASVTLTTQQFSNKKFSWLGQLSVPLNWAVRFFLINYPAIHGPSFLPAAGAFCHCGDRRHHTPFCRAEYRPEEHQSRQSGTV